MTSYKIFFSEFLKKHIGYLHFAAHSHHFWPDVTREAHLRYWELSSEHSDRKWEYIFGGVIPDAQRNIASLLNLKNAKRIAFAPNTHELVFRLLSCLPLKSPVRIVTTENEFHSFSRQILRLEQEGWVEVHRINADRLAEDRQSFVMEFCEAIQRHKPNLVFFSHVFFDSGLALENYEIQQIVDACEEDGFICIDGYHAVGAIPVDLSALEGRIFYVGGGYKYLMAGEGAAFMVLPDKVLKPRFTGWFGSMEHLGHAGDVVAYSEGGMGFLGATFDPSGLMRLNAVFHLLQENDLTFQSIHERVVHLQSFFLNHLNETRLSEYPVIKHPDATHGHFLTFPIPLPDFPDVLSFLEEQKILIDHRNYRIRFGFGLYHDEGDVQELLRRLEI